MHLKYQQMGELEKVNEISMKNGDRPGFFDMEETLKRFQNGEMAYKETMFGGCVTTRPCYQMAMRSITACINCESAVIKLSKLRRVIGAQEHFIKTLPQETVMYVAENRDLEYLKDALARFEKESEQG